MINEYEHQVGRKFILRYVIQRLTTGSPTRVEEEVADNELAIQLVQLRKLVKQIVTDQRLLDRVLPAMRSHHGFTRAHELGAADEIEWLRQFVERDIQPEMGVRLLRSDDPPIRSTDS